ncbi:MAG TPA: sigma-70 family RNA polymerase sigma factor [Pseudonocardiaceae bacterium]
MLTEGTAIPELAPGGGQDPHRRERVAAWFLAARDGDRQAMDLLVRELTPWLWHVARSQQLDREDAVDVVQETWAALFADLGAVREADRLLGWLAVTTRRRAWRVRGAGRRERPAEDEDLAQLVDQAPTAEELVLCDERRARLWAAVARLRPECQRLLRIVAFVERPDYAAISEALGMKRGGIGPTRGRCLTKLRRLLEDEGQGTDSGGAWR